MKKQLVLTAAAKRDLRNIRRHIAKDSPQNAQIFVARITAKIEWIAEVDFTGSPRDHIREGLRGFPYRKRCIYYRSLPDRVLIMRVLHGAQDVTHQEFEEN